MPSGCSTRIGCDGTRARRGGCGAGTGIRGAGGAGNGFGCGCGTGCGTGIDGQGTSRMIGGVTVCDRGVLGAGVDVDGVRIGGTFGLMSGNG